MKIFMFHLMPWAYLPASYEGPAWVKCPNSHYDARRGHDLYNRYIDELMRAEALGFDGVCVNEHHANAYGNMPSPNLIAAILARQTARMRIAVVGNALPLYNPPIRVAEEYATIDCISGGLARSPGPARRPGGRDLARGVDRRRAGGALPRAR